MKLWDRFKRTTKAPSEPEGEAPQRTKWLLTMCRKCKRVSWFGMPIPYVVTSKEPVEQLRRVNMGRGSSKRVPFTAPLRLVMGRPEKHQWRCTCGAGIKMCGVASTAEHVLAMTLYAKRNGGMT